ncbi:TPA: ATP-binding domain-containing protein, partial [Acinetobacter baumannii]|nr:ATP-binding domain-containing protein [Acinetobacter baumannii]
QILDLQLINFLQKSRFVSETANAWLIRFEKELMAHWSSICRNNIQEWEVCLDLIKKTSPQMNKDMSLELFSGKTEGTGRLILTTFHSSKGREFDAVIIFGANKGILPDKRDLKTFKSLKEVKRLFYVAVTRPKTILHLVYESKKHSEFLDEFYRRTQQS